MPMHSAILENNSPCILFYIEIKELLSKVDDSELSK